MALTDRDEDNLIISLYAMQKGLHKVITKSNRQNYAGIARAVGLDSVISPKLITAAQILQVVDGAIVILGRLYLRAAEGALCGDRYLCHHKVTDGFLEGMKFAKIAFIITDLHDELAKSLMEELERG